ncbi:MAG TPA: D-TA family PLP-dependent enzyme [Pirellulales bacterium]|jgi:D-serine deaminase-like pyridoxal phosphate-dependent protein|nr:D-TA family PLP-dependent enzyme [Pirellulales bacterium]
MLTDTEPWYAVDNIGEIASPALLVYPERVRENLRRMLDYAGGPKNLRPHVKTHKMPQLVRMKLELDIDKFKCSTLAEAEMIARSDGRDILLAFPQVGPNAARFAALAAAFPEVRFSTVADDAGLVRLLSEAASRAGTRFSVLLDIDNGMHRSGIEPGPAAVELYRLIAQLPGLVPGGLHVYDGHLRDLDFEARAKRVRDSFVPVDALKAELLKAGMSVPRIVAGGSGSFAVHAQRPDVECSPGTGVFWDLNYRAKFPELDFLYAALLLGRVVSKPGENRLCLDLGYKAVSPDNPQPRLALLEMRSVEVVNHSEEHLAVETPDAAKFSVGDPVFAVPYHVCPTVNLYREAVVIEHGHAAGRWPVLARDRQLTY